MNLDTEFQIESWDRIEVTTMRSEEDLDPSRGTLIGVISFRSVKLLPLNRLLMVVRRVTATLLPNWEKHALLFA